MKKHERFVAAEYAQGQGLDYVIVGDQSFVLPPSYKGDAEKFVEDLFSFQDEHYKRYDRYNKRHSQDMLEPLNVKITDIKKIQTNTPKLLTDGIKPSERLKTILAHAQNKEIIPEFSISPTFRQTKQGLSAEEIIAKSLKKARREYLSAIRKTARAQKEHPQQHFAITLDKKVIKNLNELHTKYCFKKIGQGLAQTFKWSGEQTLNILAGTAGALPAAAYLLDKKVRVAKRTNKDKGKIKSFVDEKALPYIRKGALKALIPLSLVATKTIISHDKDDVLDTSQETAQAIIQPPSQEIIEQKLELEKQQLAEKKEREKFFNKYNTIDETFYQNYKTAKAFEKEFIFLLSGYEGYKEEAYLCSADKYTVGYGSRFLADGSLVTKDTKVTHDEAIAAVLAHLERSIYPQLKHITRKLTPEQLLATEMFIYNINDTKFKNTRVCKAINKDYKVREALSLYRSAGGKRDYGLINRNGYTGWLYESNMADILCLNKNIIGSKDLKYYLYPNKHTRNPLENEDGTFVVRELTEVNAEIKSKFTASNLTESIVGQLSPDIAGELIAKYNIVEQDGKVVALNKPQSNTGKTLSFEHAVTIAMAQQPKSH